MENLNNRPGELLAKIKLPLLNHNQRTYTILFSSNPKFKAILHKSKRHKKQPKINNQYFNIQQIKELLSSKDYRENGLAFTTIFTARIETIIKRNFEFKKLKEEFYELTILETKTSRHTILISYKLFEALQKFLGIKLIKHLSYAKLNNLVKEKYGSTTHICRRSGSKILQEAGFDKEAINTYGNWASASTLQNNYLRTSTLRKIARFWDSVLF